MYLSSTLLAAALVATSATVALPSFTSPDTEAHKPVASSTCAKRRSHWKSWKHVKKFFVFGDSYTTTGFNVTTQQPGTCAPWGCTSSNGPNWVEDLTSTYNESMLDTINLAYGGATVDKTLVAQYLPTVIDFVGQINDEFIPYYVNKKTTHWTSGNSLFATFFGINDVGNSYTQQNDTLYLDVFAKYASLLEQLYDGGARNFLILNVPPVNVSPLTQANGIAAVALEGATIELFNDRIIQLAYNLTVNHNDTTVFVFDTHRVFQQVLTYPASYPQTEGYLNTTTYCAAYENGTPAENTTNPSCYIPVNQYFWLNSLHPTYPMHSVIAEQIVRTLNGSLYGRVVL